MNSKSQIEFYLNKDWSLFLSSKIRQPYFKSLKVFLNKEYNNHICYPSKDKVFNAFNLCPINELKVVIIGQDPYHGKGQANGLAFSVNNGISHPPSLANIFKELKNDLGLTYPKNGYLKVWSNQGVLLLNTILTVRESQPGSHKEIGWEKFTDQVIKNISKSYSNVAFMLWGTYAKEKVKLIDTSKHMIFECGHPSPLSANRGYWFGNKHFSKVNSYLKSIGKLPIDWYIK